MRPAIHITEDWCKEHEGDGVPTAVEGAKISLEPLSHIGMSPPS